MTNKIHVKKMPAENELSTPEARSERLRRLRNLANLSRKDICGLNDININTYKGWELARFGGIPLNGAEKVVKKLAQSGVICSTEWLLYGKKPTPTLIAEDISHIISNKEKISEMDLIQNEFSIYQGNTAYAVLAEIVDDGMLPEYQIGDFVAGEKKFNHEIELTVGKVCILETIDRGTLIRYVKKGRADGLYTLICTNYVALKCEVILENITLLYSAPITRHYKLAKATHPGASPQF